jgi:zinc/manganese transport system ATP-binding protein
VSELHDNGLTVLMVSHALNEVANYVERIGLLVNGRLRMGPVEEVLTEDSLSGLYGIPVEVASVGSHRIVLARHQGAHPDA